MAVGDITVTTAANFIPEIWSKDAKIATESNLVMAKLVNRQFEADMAMGDTLHIPDITDLSVRAKTANTDVTFETNTEGKIDVSIDKYYYAAFKLEDIVKVQSNQDLQARYTEKVGYALAKQIDTDLLGLYSGLSQSVGSAGVAITDANILTAIQYLDDADAPAGDRYLVLKPAQMKAILGIDKFVRADAVGYLASMSPITTGRLQGGDFNPTEVKGYFGQIYGISVYISTNVATSGSSPVSQYNLLFQKDAFLLVSQQDIRFQQAYNIRSLANEIVADTIYGVAEFRDEFAVKIVT
jgi:hypothetical protein